MKDVSRKNGTGIETETYSYLANSSGQDNLGQILLAIFSFKNLKATLKSYSGGILLIDEIDATLHPAAQFKLLDFMKKMSKELDLQIVLLRIVIHFWNTCLFSKIKKRKVYY